MGIAGSGITPYPIFRQALDAGHLQRCLNIARDLPHVSLTDALRIVELLAGADDARFERAALRWIGRYALETRDVSLGDMQRAATWLDALPDRPEIIERLRELAR